METRGVQPQLFGGHVPRCNRMRNLNQRPVEKTDESVLFSVRRRPSPATVGEQQGATAE